MWSIKRIINRYLTNCIIIVIIIIIIIIIIIEKTILDMAQLLRKLKAIPLQAWTGPKGSRRLRLPDFKTIGT